MTRPIPIIEAGAALDGTARVYFRHVCSRCQHASEWLPSLNDAEREAAVHGRTHAEVSA